ncbi:MAG: ORF6N domain-containing protein [Deltaproteobacteria bacterium]|nr:ORF6N domain-containing protein [Deltaproteobacteria bacterium]
MDSKQLIIPNEMIERSIILLRGQKVMLDADLAILYGVTTKRLNEQVKRNFNRFPTDFMFQLTQEEKGEVVANRDHLKNLKFSHALPYAFTEHGAVMLASVLNSATAIEVSIQVVRTFNRLREYVANHKALASKLALLENKYDGQFKIVFDALRELMKPPAKPRRKIGFEGKT